MSKRKCIIILLAAFMAASLPLRAQDGTGGTRSIFSLGAGSRAISMGGAFTAIGDDPSVVYYNPAALKLNPYPSAMVNHIQLFSGFSDATYDFFGLVYPTLSIGSFGLGIMTAGTGGIREFDSYSREIGEISYRESQGIMSYAFDLPWKFIGNITVGSSIKILNQRVGSFSDTGTGMDVGFLYRHDAIKGLILGCNLQDMVGARTKLVSETEKVDRTVMLGAGYSFNFSNGSALVLSTQIELPERADKDMKIGAEYRYRDRISFRMGFDSESITAGVGFSWRRYRGDYGFFSREEAGSSHPISIVARLGTPLEEKILIEERERKAAEERRIAELFSTRVRQHISSANALRAEGELEKALDELKIALEYDPTNEQATGMIGEVQQAIIEESAERTRTAEKSLLINQYFSLGLRYYSENEYILARAQWKRLLEIDPGNSDALTYLERTEEKLVEQIAQHRYSAEEHERRGQLAAAVGEWNIIRMIDPENAEALSSIERISRRMEELDRNYRAANSRLRTIEFFEDALKAFSEGRYSDAAGLLEQVLQRQPDHAEARDLLARVKRKMTPLTDEEKEQIRQYYIEGMKHFTLKKYAESIEVWQKILEIDPDNESVRKNIEEAHQRLEKLESPEDG